MIDWLAENWLWMWLIGSVVLYFPVVGFTAMIMPAHDHTDGEDVFWTMLVLAIGCLFWPAIVVLIGVAVPLAIPYGIGYWMLTYKHRHANKTVTARAS